MTIKTLTFAEWQLFEASSIVRKALAIGPEHQTDYLFVQIRDAIEGAYRHGANGRIRGDFMEWVSPKP